MRKPSPYLMRDFNSGKIDTIMDFNVTERRSRSRSVLEFGLFIGALFGYLGALAIST